MESWHASLGIAAAVSASLRFRMVVASASSGTRARQLNTGEKSVREKNSVILLGHYPRGGGVTGVEKWSTSPDFSAASAWQTTLLHFPEWPTWARLNSEENKFVWYRCSGSSESYERQWDLIAWRACVFFRGVRACLQFFWNHSDETFMRDPASGGVLFFFQLWKVHSLVFFNAS